MIDPSPDTRAELRRFRVQATVALVWLLLVVNVLDIGGQLAKGHTAAAIRQAVALPMVPLCLVLIRRGYADLTAHLVLSAVALLTVLAGMLGSGLHGTAVYLVLTLPMLGALFAGRRGGIIWTLGAVGILGMIWSGHALGTVDLRPALHPTVATRLRDLLVAMGLIAGAGACVVWLQRRAFHRLDEALAALKVEVAERTRAEGEARLAALARSRFLATMSHELRTPLNGVICATRMLHRTRSPARRAELEDVLMASADGVLSLVDAILDHAKLDAGRIELESVPVDVRDLVRTSLASLAVLAEERGLVWRQDVAAEVPRWLQTDPTRLQQILLNLTGNALKFTEEGGVAVSVRWVDEALAICVVDSGAGIPSDALETIFDAYAQAEASTTRIHGGTGLGLAIVAGIVEQMGGTITVDSTVGRGTTFRVRLPVVACAPPIASPSEQPPPLPDQLRVLVVDDTPVNLQLQVMLIEAWGYSALGVDSGEAAVQAVQDSPWDVILMDGQMPGMDGEGAARRIRALGPATQATRIIGLSADATPEARTRALAAGMDAYLTKPLRRDQLEAALAMQAA